MQPAVKSGTIWIAYSWQDTLVSMKAAKVPVAFMNPSQGRLSWLCGFMLGANTKNYYHAHDYVESFINHNACAQMTNLYYYGTSNAAVQPSRDQEPGTGHGAQARQPERHRRLRRAPADLDAEPGGDRTGLAGSCRGLTGASDPR